MGNYPLELTIHLDHLEHNLQQFRALLNPATKIMVMVKADAYGCGAVEVSKRLEKAGVDYLGVAYTQEGTELRKAGIRLPIMVLAPMIEEFPELIEHHLEPEISHLDQLIQWIKFLEENNTYDPGFHLKIETGLHRLGVMENKTEELIRLLRDNHFIKIRSVFSHLAASPALDHDDFTHLQARRFEKINSFIRQKLVISPDRHLLNSAGIFRFPQYQYEMVRLGIGIYGVGLEDLEIFSTLKPVQELRTTVVQVKEVRAGESIGYNRMEKAFSPMRIAVLRAGYADGISRRAGNRRFSVHIEGGEYPVIGNICMDMIMVDITGATRIGPGSMAEIYGSRNPVNRLAEACDTIPYEILTANHRRAKRTYIS